MTFAKKIFISVFLSTALIIGAISITILLWISSQYIRTTLYFERELARLAVLKTENYILRNERMELYQFCTFLLQIDRYITYFFVERQGAIIVHSFEKGVPKGFLKLRPLQNQLETDIQPIQNNDDKIIYHLRVGIGDPVHSILHLGISDQKIRNALRPLRILTLLAGGILLFIVPFALAIFIAGLVSRPLRSLSRGVSQIGEGFLDYRIHLTTGDEIEQLANDINTMAGNLKRLQDGLKEEIKEREQAQAELAEQRELLDNVLNHVPHNVFWKDKRLVYLGCNKAFARTAGLDTPKSIIGKSENDLPWKEKEAATFIQIEKKILETAEPIHEIEETLTQANGRERAIITSKVPLKNQKGEVFGLLGIFYDITERKQLEETIKQSQKMEAIGTLAGGIAHDFNNILGGIIGYTELAIDDSHPESPARSHLGHVLKSANRAKDLVRQILTFSRKSQEKRRPILISTIVKEELKMLRSTLPTTIEIRQDISDQAGMVNADPTNMHQIVMNLCTNAAHAMQENGGRLDISLTPTILEAKSIKEYHSVSPGPYVKLKISDTGAGIDSRIIHRIFEPFFTTKDKEKGTGMGLAVVHGIVRDHGGDIIVESQVGKGTTFTVLLPQVISEPQKEKDDSGEIHRGYEHILLVDDEKTLLNLGEKQLKSLGYKVTPMTSSIAALDHFQKNPDLIDIVITDQTMPHLTGLDLAKRILAIKPSTPIILCTGYSENVTKQKIEDIGIKALLYKPLGRKDIANAIRGVMDARNAEEWAGFS